MRNERKNPRRVRLCSLFSYRINGYKFFVFFFSLSQRFVVYANAFRHLRSCS